jgi:hypothetical protein
MITQSHHIAELVKPNHIKRIFYSAFCALAFGFLAASAFAQTVTADFDSRSGKTHSIPPRAFGINAVNLQDPSTLRALVSAGITESRAMGSIPAIYATSEPKWDQFDWEMTLLQNQGLHPLVTLAGSPTWLLPSPNPCISAGGQARNAPPTDMGEWAKIAASYVAHLDLQYPGLVHSYEIWNEPELQQSFCVADDTDATRLATYLKLYAAAASAMHAQAARDGVSIKVGGPVISEFSLAPEWIPALLAEPTTYPYVDFISYHMYLTGQTQISGGMDWSQLYAFTQSSTRGEVYNYLKDLTLIRKGLQTNPQSTPIYITEFNDNWVFAQDCCRNHPIYGPLWNSVAVVDFLNTVYAGANSVPTKMFYFAGSAAPYFCIAGAWNASMNCDASALDLYPQYYSYELLASATYLGLSAGGHMAKKVTPVNTQSGLLATAFYTTGQDSIVIVNPSSTSYSAVTVQATGSGYLSPAATVFTLNEANPKIDTEPLALKTITGGFQATVSVPAYTTVAVTLIPSQAPVPLP